MKRELILWTSLMTGMFFLLGGSYTFKIIQEREDASRREDLKNLHLQIRSLKQDLIFLKIHERKIYFLEKKGWFTPKNRLIAADSIERFQGKLNKVSYTFESETNDILPSGHRFKATKLVIDIKAVFDTDIYDFIEKLTENFSGILVPRTIILMREEKINRTAFLSLKNNQKPTFISGQLCFDWLAMTDSPNEK